MAAGAISGKIYAAAGWYDSHPDAGNVRFPMHEYLTVRHDQSLSLLRVMLADHSCDPLIARSLPDSHPKVGPLALHCMHVSSVFLTLVLVWQPTNVLEVFDPIEKEWQEASPCIEKRAQPGYCVYRKCLWMAGGLAFDVSAHGQALFAHTFVTSILYVSVRSVSLTDGVRAHGQALFASHSLYRGQQAYCM